MAGGWPTVLGPCNSKSYGQSTGGSSLTTVASNVSANTKGLYVQLTASSTADATGIIVQLSGFSSTGTYQSVDIGVGAAGVEKIIAADLAMQDYGNGTATYFLPVSIAIGSRIAAKSQGTSASDAIEVGLITLDGGSWADTVGGCDSDTIGFTGSGTYGTLVDPGTSANTNGVWVQLTASTASDYSGFVMSVGRSANNATAATFLWDVAIGGVGSEKVILSQYPGWALTTGQLNPTVTSFIGIPIAAGSRVAVRAYCSNATLAVRTLWVTMYAIVQ